ncbi:hypothetical protein J1779_21535 [Rahnella sp. FC061912-K]|uniref:hypothetical protein n=1 Tax=Rahnella rivi TaxID=2816249 RepID=UPI001C257353|nr:hypothetical protein [Rahnella rivi]MBU9832509.1 hypothetical protein [Rahnella rivi]
MESKSKVLFAYPVAYKEDMTKEEMCIPSPFLTGFEPDSVQPVVITVGYTIDFNGRNFILVCVDKTGEEKDRDNITLEGRSETLKGGFFNNNTGVFLSSFFLRDLKVTTSGYYEIEVTLYEADENGGKSDVIINRHTSEFWVQVKVPEA